MGVDTTLVLLNTNTLSDADLAGVIDFLVEQNVKLIALNINLDSREEIDSSLLVSLKNSSKKIVISCDQSRDVAKNAYYNNIEYGPSILYQNENDEVTSFSFLYKDETDFVVETLYLKMVKYVRPELYDKVKNDSSIYKIKYIGGKQCFPSVLYKDLRNTVEGAWSDKIVLLGHLGSTESYLIQNDDEIDVFHTPISRDGKPETKDVYGTVIIANIISALLKGEANETRQNKRLAYE